MIELTERERSVLQVIVGIWLDADMPICGHTNYLDAIHLLEKLELPDDAKRVLRKLSKP